MIRSFRDRDTKELWETGRNRRLPPDLWTAALRKLLMIEVAATLDDLRIPPANRLKKLKGDRKGQYSIPINDQFRICFVWQGGHTHEVEVTDYH